jgi:hypothetical protein
LGFFEAAAASTHLQDQVGLMHHNSLTFRRNCLLTNQMTLKCHSPVAVQVLNTPYQLPRKIHPGNHLTGRHEIHDRLLKIWVSEDETTRKALTLAAWAGSLISRLKFRGKQKCLDNRMHHCPPVAVCYVHSLYSATHKFVRSCEHTIRESSRIYSHALNTVNLRSMCVQLDATHRLMVTMIY